MLDDLEPPKKRFRWWPLIISAVLVVLIGVGVVALVMVLLQPANTAPANQKVTPASIVLPTFAPIPSGQPALFDLNGNGSTTSSKFNVAGDWDLNWAYDCSSFGQGNFTVYIYENSKLSFENGSVGQFGAKGTNVVHYHNGGTYYLQVITSCAWHLRGALLTPTTPSAFFGLNGYN